MKGKVEQETTRILREPRRQSIWGDPPEWSYELREALT